MQADVERVAAERGLEEIDILIPDSGLSKRAQTMLEAAEVRIIIA